MLSPTTTPRVQPSASQTLTLPLYGSAAVHPAGRADRAALRVRAILTSDQYPRPSSERHQQWHREHHRALSRAPKAPISACTSRSCMPRAGGSGPANHARAQNISPSSSNHHLGDAPRSGGTRSTATPASPSRRSGSGWPRQAAWRRAGGLHRHGRDALAVPGAGTPVPAGGDGASISTAPTPRARLTAASPRIARAGRLRSTRPISCWKVFTPPTGPVRWPGATTMRARAPGTIPGSRRRLR